MPPNYSSFVRLLCVSQLFGIVAVILVGVWMGGFGEGAANCFLSIISANFLGTFFISSFRFGFQDRPDLEFRWHPLLMSTSILFLNGEAIVLYRAFRNSPKAVLKRGHAAIQATVIAIYAVGLKAAWDSHDLNRNPATGERDPLPNLYSMHSWCGIATVALFIVQFFVGLISFFWPGIPELARTALIPVHRLAGILIFILALVAAMMGLSERAAWKATCWVQRQEFCAEMLIINMFGATLVAYACCILLLVIHPDWIRQSLSNDEVFSGHRIAPKATATVTSASSFTSSL